MAQKYRRLYLHSNMVRFIIRKRRPHSSKTKDIYIPIWLDLLFGNQSASGGMTT